MRILIVTAVDIERNAVLRGLQDTTHCDVLTVGVGPVAATVNTAMKIATTPYNLVVNMGIAGGFHRHAPVGSLAIADRVICADLGAETLEGFLDLHELGFGAVRIETDPSLVMQIGSAFTKSGITTTIGPILTVSTTTGTIETATKLSLRAPGAIAEAMEGFGVASAAQAYGIPFLEIRAISNPVGPRDKTTWRIDEALDMLTAASHIIAKEESLRENRVFTMS